MDADVPKIEVKIDPSKAVRSPNAFTIFINHTRFGHTKWDIQMICGQVTLSTDPNHETVQELGLISMSPIHAKAVLTALGEGIAGYEREYGEIQEPIAQAVPVSDTKKPKRLSIKTGSTKRVSS